MVLVVHRLEDVPSVVTHGALMREGRLVACGPVEEVLTDAPMSACFGTPLRVSRDGGRWTVR